ncbi:M48 family metalloprotease [Rhodobacterales bacterium HKCCE3408]|nr:M48 family metalloprotease [Rhodobacterales bacterium HKCCE3408]
MFQRLRERLETRLSEQVYLDALKDAASGTALRRTRPETGALIMAIAILAVPVLTVLIGLGIIWITDFAIFAVFIGLLFIAFGLYLLPWPRRPFDGIEIGPAEAPEIFAALDTVTDGLGAPPIDAIVVTDDFNAAIARHLGRTILMIGALLWQAASPAERHALVAHEVAHLVNGDPRRRGLPGAALTVLDRWLGVLGVSKRVKQGYYATLNDYDRIGYSAITEIMLMPIQLVVELLDLLLLRLVFIGAHRSEYLADSLAAAVAGRTPLQSLLDKAERAGVIAIALKRLDAARLKDGRELLERLSGAFDDPTIQTEPPARGPVTTAGTHPPTALRKGFIDSLPGTPETAPAPPGLSEPDPAFEAAMARIGDRLLARLEEASH